MSILWETTSETRSSPKPCQYLPFQRDITKENPGAWDRRYSQIHRVLCPFSYQLESSNPQNPFGYGLHETPDNCNTQEETSRSSVEVGVRLFDGSITLLSLNVENPELR